MARYPKLDVIFCGQSQCLMAFNGGGELNDADIAETGAARLARRLGEVLPGTTITTSGAANQTFKASTPLFEEFGVPADSNVSFYVGNPFSNKTDGTSQRSYITGRKAADKLGVMLLFCQSQDAQMPAMETTGLYATCVGNYVDAIMADNASGWGDFAILPVLASARSGQSSSSAKQNVYRQVWASIAGDIPTFQGATRRSGVLRPVYNVGHISPAGFSGGGDWTHIVRSAAQRYLDAAAIRISGWAGGVPPVVDQPRLSRAVLVNPTTLRAYIAVGKRGSGLLHQHGGAGGPQGGFSLSAGSISAKAAPNASASASTGYVTIDLTVSGVTNPSRLFYRTGLAEAPFANAQTPPRGDLWGTMVSIPPGVSLSSITDAAEDLKLPANQWAVAGSNNDYGVPVEFP